MSCSVGVVQCIDELKAMRYLAACRGEEGNISRSLLSCGITYASGVVTVAAEAAGGREGSAMPKKQFSDPSAESASLKGGGGGSPFPFPQRNTKFSCPF